jgi:hypothetical protein
MADRAKALVPPYALVGMYPYKEHPWTAQKLVSDLERRALAARQWLEDNDWDPLVDAVTEDGHAARGVFMPSDPTMAHHVRMTIQEVAVHKMWGKSRVVLDIHPGMIGHLRSSDSDKFPPLVLKHLTHLNPLIFLGEPVMLKDSAGKPIRLIGWYAAGMTGRQHYVDTQDERAEAFHLTAVSEVLSDNHKEVIDWDYCRITLPITGADATVGELIAQGMNRFAWDPTIMDQTENAQQQYMSGLLHVMVPHMLYLVSQNLESKPKPFTAPAPPRRNKWDRKQGGGKVDRYLVGYHSGPVLASLEGWEGDEVEPRGPKGEQGSRKSPRPHWRRAHFHTYRYGPGRTERKVKWLGPMPINADGSVADTTIVKVK